jgi:predicted ATPase
MSKIKIKNFGPIKEGFKDTMPDGSTEEWMDIKKVTLLIGNQGSGKSTVAKLISTFVWLEKALVRGDYDSKWFTQKNRFLKLLAYHRIENYYHPKGGMFDTTEIDYIGVAFRIKYANGELGITKLDSIEYQLPQVMYVPAERNFLDNVKDAKTLILTSQAMLDFVSVYGKSLAELKGTITLPINDVQIDYNKQFDIVYVKGEIKGDPYKIRLSDASSGFQSIVPLFLVSWYLANSVKNQSGVPNEPMSSEEMDKFRREIYEILHNKSFTEEQRRIALSVLTSKFNKTAFINIVEEPEQNLFPTSQQQILHSLLAFNNLGDANRLIMTTHSPYLINFLSVAIQAADLKDQIVEKGKKELLPKLYGIVPENALVKADDVQIYQLDERQGRITKLPTEYGIPSDDNYLNRQLKLGNDQFDALLDIEAEL